MSGRKAVLQSYQVVTNGDMSGNVISEVTDIRYFDNIAYQFNFTGTPTGALTIEGSIDGSNYINLGVSTMSLSGASGFFLRRLNNEGFPYIRAVYTAGSGSGTLNAFISAKMI